MEDCLFCNIIAANKQLLYLDSHTAVLLDIFPVSENHLLIIPIEHSPKLHNLSEKSLQNILITIKNVANKLGIKEYNVLQNNGNMQTVDHVHFHLIPFNSENDCLKIDWKSKKLSEDEISKKIEKIKLMLNKI